MHNGRKGASMDLREFVVETLTEILAGIRAARKKDQAVGAELRGMPPQGSLLVRTTTRDAFTIVEFDVSVVAETTAGGKAGLKVWSVGGMEGEGKRSDQQTNRVRFAVQMTIPMGEKGPPEPYDE